MRNYDIAYVHSDGNNLVLVPVHPWFGMRPARDMRRFAAAVRAHAVTAGLAGEVVPVWDDGAGGLMAFARPSVMPQLAGLSWERVRRHVNVRLHVGRQVVETRPESRDESQAVESLAS